MCEIMLLTTALAVPTTTTTTTTNISTTTSLKPQHLLEAPSAAQGAVVSFEYLISVYQGTQRPGDEVLNLFTTLTSAVELLVAAYERFSLRVQEVVKAIRSQRRATEAMNNDARAETLAQEFSANIDSVVRTLMYSRMTRNMIGAYLDYGEYEDIAEQLEYASLTAAMPSGLYSVAPYDQAITALGRLVDSLVVVLVVSDNSPDKPSYSTQTVRPLAWKRKMVRNTEQIEQSRHFVAQSLEWHVTDAERALPPPIVNLQPEQLYYPQIPAASPDASEVVGGQQSQPTPAWDEFADLVDQMQHGDGGGAGSDNYTPTQVVDYGRGDDFYY